MRNKFLLAFTLMSLTSGAAFAHVTLGEPTALPGAQYVAHFHVGHGCSGSPTTAISVALPRDVSNVQAKAAEGWSIATVRAGGRISAITWKGGKLASDAKGEFVMTMNLPRKAATLAFPVFQACEKGSENWSELPAADGHHLDKPAPVLTVSATQATPAAPAAAPNTTLTLSDGWIRLLPGSTPAGGYFTLQNHGATKVTLTGADSPACGGLMLHKSDDKGGMSSMQDVKQVDVPAGGSLSFAPGGYHLMCMDPRPVLRRGASVPVTLSFQGMPPLTAQFAVRGANGK